VTHGAKLGIAAVIVVIVIAAASQMFQSVPPGHVGVASLFGQVIDEPFEEGMHFPVNPLYNWTMFDARQKTIKETVGVPSQDQLTTMVDVSVQYRLDGSRAPMILRETGQMEDVLNVHVIPRVRSLLREQGKSIVRAEDFFLETTQQQIQRQVSEGLKASLAPAGVEVQDVLLRDIRLPEFIVRAIESKKEREQAAEREKAELERSKTQFAQQVEKEKAARLAAEEEAEKRKVLADAQAYEIERINEAVAGSPAYIQLQALEALKQISKDPAAKVYFMDGASPQPLPLMHMGDRAVAGPTGGGAAAAQR